MDWNLKRKLLAGGLAVAGIAGGGAAIAATQSDSPQQESQAVVNDAAQQLGIEPAKLSDALKKALENRVDAAVTAGRITKAEGDALKQRIESGDVPLVGFPHGGHFAGGPFHGLDAAATYLGLTEAQLRTQLESGKNLAQVAKDHGKTADGLIQALVDDAQKQLDAAVTAGRLTKDQEQEMLSGLKQRITDLVNGTRPGFGFRHFDRGADSDGPPA